MSEERRRILDMLAQGKITVNEADQLLNAVGAQAHTAGVAIEETQPALAKRKPKYLHVLVDEAGRNQVNVRVPMQLVRAGVKLSALIPKEAQEKMGSAMASKGINIDLANLNPETLEELVEGLGDLSVDINESGGAKVRVFCE